MPIKHAAAKSLRQSKKATEKNRTLKNSIKKLRKDILVAVTAKDTSKVQDLVKQFSQQVDKASKGSTLHRNTGRRLKSRLMAKVNAAKVTKA